MIDADGVLTDGQGLPLFWVGLLVFLGAVGLGACDQLAGPSVSIKQENETASLIPDSSVLFIPMTPDDRLLPPGKSPTVDLGSLGSDEGEAPHSPDRLATLGSAYGCVMSTPNVGGEKSYRYEAVYAFFPERIAGEANDEVQQYRLTISRPEVQAESSTPVTRVLRQARCRIPASAGAQELIGKRLMQVPSPSSSWEGAIGQQGEEAVPPQGSQSKVTCGRNEKKKKIHKCWEICVIFCEVECGWVTKCVKKSDDSQDGDGSGDDQTGDDPDECNYDGGASDELCNGSSSTSDSDTTSFPCELSASELEDGDYLFDQASDSTKNTFIATLEEHGGDYGLDSKKDVKHFIAQTAHESGGKITAVETAGAATSNISREDIENSKYVGPNSKYSVDEVMGDKKLMVNIHRANTLGNGPPSSGDGWTYRGRGPIQLTWKGAYRNFTNHYQSQGFGNANFVKNPEKLSNNARIGTLAALWYWENRVLPDVDGDLTVKKLTQAINNGTTGLQDRKNQFEAAKDAINCDS